MDKIKQRIALAEIRGWKHIFTHKWLRGVGMEGGDEYCELGGQNPFTGDDDHIPDYPKDLNAVHEFETFVEQNHIDVWYQYGELLVLKVVREPENIRFGDKPTKKFPLNGFGFAHLAHATAAQRVEMLLRAFGKWEGEK